MIGEHQNYLKDVSQYVLCFKSLGCIKPATLLSINVPFSDGTHYIRGKIAWCLPMDDTQYLLGVKFEDIVTQSASVAKFLNISIDEEGFT
jgi:hypothetical protein